MWDSRDWHLIVRAGNVTDDGWDLFILQINYTGVIDIPSGCTVLEITLRLLHLMWRNVSCMDLWAKINISFIISFFSLSSPQTLPDITSRACTQTQLLKNMFASRTSPLLFLSSGWIEKCFIVGTASRTAVTERVCNHQIFKRVLPLGSVIFPKLLLNSRHLHVPAVTPPPPHGELITHPSIHKCH